jgi:hypothetical protein
MGVWGSVGVVKARKDGPAVLVCEGEGHALHGYDGGGHGSA